MLRAAFAAAYVAYLGLFSVLARSPSFSVASGDPSAFLWWALLWLPYLGLAAAAARGRLRLPRLLPPLLALPFFALTLAAEPPDHEVALGGGRTQVFRGWFSNDHHRFLLDGELILEGEDPYRVVPEDLAGTSRPGARHAPFVNHADLPTFYPPLAEGWFLLVALSGLGWRGLAAGNALAVAAAVLLLGDLLRRRGQDGALVLLFALNPLLLLESALGLHYDPLVLLALLATLWCLETGRRTGAAACWTAAVGLKLFPLLLLPVLLPKLGWRRTLGAGAALLLLLVPFATARTLDVYRAFAAMSHHPSPLALLLPAAGKALVLLAVLAWFTRRPGRNGAFLLYPVLALILLADTVHPWYLLWILPFALLDLRERWPVLAYAFLVFFAYAILGEYLRGGPWRPAPALSQVLWLLFLLGLTVAAHRRLGKGRRWGFLLLVWPVVPLLLLGYRYEVARFSPEWAASFPYLAWSFGEVPPAPWALRLLAIWPVRLLALATGLGPVLCGYLLLGAGHLAALLLLRRLAGRAFLLYLLAPYFWLLPWGQIAGPLTGPPEAAWHFSQFAEAVYLPLAFLAILLIRRGARGALVIPLLALLLGTKESAFLLVAAYWTARSGFAPRAVLPSAALGLAYLAALRLTGLENPAGAPLLLPAFAADHLARNGWAIVAAAAWAAPLGAVLARGVRRENAIALLLYGGTLLLFSMFWETRLWLVAAPCLLEGPPATSREG